MKDLNFTIEQPKTLKALTFALIFLVIYAFILFLILIIFFNIGI